ncbi:GcrA family cell cycle regulator [Phenylobacterium sp.]|uniref:GcrA family cell cycle regulator n=1 Tax=Phenylobacterium sp. TaxID=1871053 RepID=UPI002C9DE643|nr:GcrA family cell cycle regulator [Phenylobacterium sp.]HVI33763.1 GcrA family cell cycle regulator [Phenylobacterium sp.]
MRDLRWTGDRVTALRTLWAEGRSAAEIARSLGGVTRNAVLGKVWRLGLCGGRSHPPPKPARPRPGPPRRTARARPSARAGVPSAPGPEVGPGLVARLLDLGPRQCRWPMGDPRSPGFAFCGREAACGPYCRAHAQAAHVRA